MGELVTGADDKILESVVRVQIRIEKRAAFRFSLLGRLPFERRRIFVKDKLDMEYFSKRLL